MKLLAEADEVRRLLEVARVGDDFDVLRLRDGLDAMIEAQGMTAPPRNMDIDDYDHRPRGRTAQENADDWYRALNRHDLIGTPPSAMETIEYDIATLEAYERHGLGPPPGYNGPWPPVDPNRPALDTTQHPLPDETKRVLSADRVVDAPEG